MPKNPSSPNSAAPYSPRLTTTKRGPRDRSLRAARTVLGSRVRARTSASFRRTASTVPIASRRAPRWVSIHRFIESRPTSLAALHSARTADCSPGEEAGGGGEVRGGSAEHAPAPPEGGLDGIDRQGADDDGGHAARHPPTQRPPPGRSGPPPMGTLARYEPFDDVFEEVPSWPV